jgi:hypothetical protein
VDDLDPALARWAAALALRVFQSVDDIAQLFDARLAADRIEFEIAHPQMQCRE